MTEFWLPEVDLDIELSVRRNISLARLVVLNVLAYARQPYQTEVLKHLHPEHFRNAFDRFLFENMVDMIRNRGQVDVEELRRRIPSFAPEATEFIEGCLANYAQMLSFNPTPEQVERAFDLLTSPLPPYPVFPKPGGGDNQD
jgi:hypothetical protein